jgi:ribosomal protein S18 acetylase RimI-like enzyme
MTLAFSSALSQMAEIYADAFSSPPWNEFWTKERALADLREYSLDNLYYLDKEEQVTSFGVCVPLQEYPDYQMLAKFCAPTIGNYSDYYYIAELATHREHRRCGLCSLVLNKIESQAKSLGYKNLITRTKEDNLSLLSILKRIGYVEVGKYEVTTGGVLSTRLVFTKNIR